MTTFAWFIFVAIIALSLAAMAVQGWATLKGEFRTAYVAALVVCGTGGGLIAWDVSPTVPYAALGGASGLGAVVLGPLVLRGAGAVIRGVAGRIGRGE